MITLLLIAMVITAASGLPGLAVRPGRPFHQHLATILHIGGCVVGLFGALLGLTSGTATAVWAWNLPSGTIVLRVDALSAFFLVPVFVVAGLGSLYGEGYWPERDHISNARKLRCFYGLVTAGLVLVMIAGDAWSFLVGWEIVGLAAFFLVTTEQDEPEALRAGWIYLVAAHVGTLVLLAMFALLYQASGTWQLTPSASLAHSPLLVPILTLGLVGFSIKAGVMPLHIWLPVAHAAAPSHISALLSGVVLKMGIYGLVRLLSLLPTYPLQLGIALLALGITSGVLGVAFALAQHDLKRLLAYHSIENIGIILMGLGVGVLGVATGHGSWAMLGFAGGLLHVWNHAAFKALLFYAAGAVVHTTGTRDIDALGGLLRPMRVAGATFLIGAVAICGLPPLNGFVSEWLLYLGSFRALLTQRGTAGTLAAGLVAPALALIGALAVACFVKVFTVVFLGAPRTHLSKPVHDATPGMQIAMSMLAAACIVIGVWPQGAVGLTARAIDGLVTNTASTLTALVQPLSTAAALVLLGSLAAGAVLWMLTLRRVVRGTWDCGYAMPTPRMQYTASSFAQGLIALFRWVLLPIRHAPHIDAVFPASAAFHSDVPDPVLDRVLLPGLLRGHRAMGWVRVIQVGHIQAYLAYIVLTLVILLAWSLL